MIMVNGKTREVNTPIISETVNKLEYTDEEKAYIARKIEVLIDDLDYDKEFMHGEEPEVYYTEVVKRYLNEHSFDELYACADDTEIFDYCY